MPRETREHMQGVLFLLKRFFGIVAAAAASSSGDLRKIPLTPLAPTNPPHAILLSPLFQSNSGRSGKAKGAANVVATAADSRTKWNTMMERKIGSCDKGIFLKGRRRRRRSVYPRKRGEGRRGCRVPSHSDKGKRVIFFPGAP